MYLTTPVLVVGGIKEVWKKKSEEEEEKELDQVYKWEKEELSHRPPLGRGPSLNENNHYALA